MAFGSRTIAEYDVGFNIDLGVVTGKLGAVGDEFARTTGRMSNNALALAAKQERLTRAIATSGPQSTRTKQAYLAYRQELERVNTTQTRSVTATGRHTSALKQEEHQIGRSARGALAASGVFRGLGRSVAFASSTFLGGYGLIYALESATKAAAHQQTAEGQLRTALKNRGQATDQLRGQVAKLAADNAKLGFGELELTKALTLGVTATGSLAGATRLLSVAQNISRQTGKDLFGSMQDLVRGFEGSTRAAKALGVEVAKGTKGFVFADAVQAKYAGRAVAYAKSSQGAQARLNAELERTKVTIGTELLPVEVKIADAVANWLGKTKNQQKIQHDLNVVLKTGGGLVHDFGSALHYASIVLGPLNKVLGGTKHTVELLGAAMLAMKVRAIAIDMGLLAANTARAGGAAAVAAGEYNALAGAEGRAAAAGGVAGGLGGGFPLFRGPSGVVNRINQYTGGGGTPVATPGLPGGLGGLPLAFFGATPDKFDAPKIYIDGKAAGAYLGSKFPKPGSVETINGRTYVVTYKSGSSDIFLVSVLPTSATGRGPGVHGALTANRAPIPTAGTSTTTKVPGISRATQIALAVQRAQLGVARGDKGAQQQLVAALKAQIDLDRQDEQLQERLARTDVKNRKAHLAALQLLYADEQSALDQIASINHKNDTATTKKQTAARKAAAARLKAKREHQKKLDALIALYYKEDTHGFSSAAGAALHARSAGLNKLYADQIAQASALAKKTQAKTAAKVNTGALARELQDAVAGLAQYAPNIEAALGTNVTVNQHFPHMPTPDYSREAIYARHALQAAFD